jgi:hypothetical protein
MGFQFGMMGTSEDEWWGQFHYNVNVLLPLKILLKKE